MTALTTRDLVLWTINRVRMVAKHGTFGYRLLDSWLERATLSVACGHIRTIGPEITRNDARERTNVGRWALPPITLVRAVRGNPPCAGISVQFWLMHDWKLNRWVMQRCNGIGPRSGERGGVHSRPCGPDRHQDYQKNKRRRACVRQPADTRGSSVSDGLGIEPRREYGDALQSMMS